MAIKELQTRIALKYDSYSAWTTAPGKDLVLLAGEIGICHIGDANQESNVVPTVLFKVGDGTKKFYELPWASAKAADVYGWAKSETVVLEGTTIKFKTGETVNHTIDLSSFATDAEVETIRSGLDSRITALEGKFTGDNDVQGQINALDDRLDVIQGADTVEGSVAKALKDAKAYTDTRETAITTAYEAYADQAETDAKAYADTELAKDRSRITAVEGSITTITGEGAGSIKQAVADAVTEVKAYADTAEADAVSTAKSYTDTREAAIKTAYEAYADQAEADAKSYADDELSKAVGTINAKDAEQDAAIDNKLNKATYDAYIVGKSMSDADLKKYAEDEADAAQTAAIAAAKAETETQISTLVTTGQVKTNTDAIATNASEITRVEGLVTAEAKARDDADKAIDERLDKVEAFFVGAAEDSEGLNDALDKLVDIQNYLNGEGSATDGLMGQVSANATAIENIQKEFNTDAGRVKVAEGKIAALEAKDTELANADTALGQRIDALVGDNGTITKGDAATLASAKSYTDDRETLIRSELKTAYEAYANQAEADAVTAANGYTDDKVSDLSAKDTEIEGKVTTLQNIVDGYTAKGSIKTAIETAQEQADKGVEDAGKAQAAADKAQGEIDALELVVGNETTGLAATKVIADKADAKSIDNASRLDTAEGEIDALQAIVSTGTNSNANLRSAITDLQTLTGDAAKGNEALYTELARVAGLVDNTTTGLAATKAIADQNKTDIGTLNGKVTAIENDYVKASDLVSDFYVFNCGTSTTVTHVVPEN